MEIQEETLVSVTQSVIVCTENLTAFYKGARRHPVAIGTGRLKRFWAEL